MPLLTLSSSTEPERTGPFFEELAALYADIMDSETRFLSIRLDSVPRENLWLGRAETDSDIVVLEADIREGRPPEQRREFALAFMEKLHEEWGVPTSNTKVVFTEHEGAHLMGYDRIGSDWDAPDRG